MEHKIELLAPAGSFDALTAAINAGADAVYLGGNVFGARAYANNFDREEMTQAVRYAHLHQVQIFVTVNTLVDDSEMEDLSSYLVFLNRIGADGIIVQDLGVVRLARQLVPELPLHASTQMTITNLEGVRFAAAQGMTRVVLARELSLRDIQAVCAASPIEIEVFIHGALCVCYSGQCLMSSLIGGRSGNRGRCAQPCRLPYKLEDTAGHNLLEGQEAGQYLLSPKDLCTLDVLPLLLEAGVTSLKIEGRMKKPEYVAVVVDIYRRAIDAYLAGDYHISDQDRQNIKQIFNRDFTTAYLERPQGKNMMSDKRPNNRGLLIGRVAEVNHETGTAVLKLERELHLGDGLEFWVTVGGRLGKNVDSLRVNGQEVSRAEAGTLAEIAVPRGVRFNDRVFRTLDQELMDHAHKFTDEKSKKRIPVGITVEARLGQPMHLHLTDDLGHSVTADTDFIIEKARKHPLDEETVRKQMSRLGTTEYELAELVLQADPGVMVPMSEMNEVRRRACEALDQERLNDFAPARKAVPGKVQPLTLRKVHPAAAQVAVWVDTPAKVRAALEGGADWLVFGGEYFNSKDVSMVPYHQAAELVRRAGRHLAFTTPRIIRDGQIEYFRRFLQEVEKIHPDLLYLNNNGMVMLMQEVKCALPFRADLGLNIYNSCSLDFWQGLGAEGAVLSLELNMGQIEQLARTAALPLECQVQGPIEMMVSEYCAPGSFLGGLHQGSCHFRCQEPTYLRDRTEARFQLVGDQFCRMHVLNSQDLSVLTSVPRLEKAGISRVRIDARSYNEEEVKNFTQMYKKAVQGVMTVTENLPHTTRGHYYRGVL